jgi:hypothetical protein
MAEDDTIGSPRLLCAQLQWPGQSRPAEQRDETASVHHSITLSAPQGRVGSSGRAARTSSCKSAYMVPSSSSQSENLRRFPPAEVCLDRRPHLELE